MWPFHDHRWKVSWWTSNICRDETGSPRTAKILASSEVTGCTKWSGKGILAFKKKESRGKQIKFNTAVEICSAKLLKHLFCTSGCIRLWWNSALNQHSGPNLHSFIKYIIHPAASMISMIGELTHTTLLKPATLQPRYCDNTQYNRRHSRNRSGWEMESSCQISLSVMLLLDVTLQKWTWARAELLLRCFI